MAMVFGFTRQELVTIFERRNLIPPSPRQLLYWYQTGLIDVTMLNAKTPLYSFQTVLDLMVIARILESGISLQRVRKALAYLEETFGWRSETPSLESFQLITDGTDIYKPKDLDHVISLLKRPGQIVWKSFIFPPGEIIKEAVEIISLKGWRDRLLERERHYLTLAG